MTLQDNQNDENYRPERGGLNFRRRMIVEDVKLREHLLRLLSGLGAHISSSDAVDGFP